MDRITRKNLKDDKFAAEVSHSVEYISGHRQQVLRYGGVAAVVLALAVGIFFYRQHRKTLVHQALYKALETHHALVTIENRANFAFGDLKLSCTAQGPAGQEVGVQERELASARDGAMPPGSVTKVMLSFDTPKAEVRSLSCNALVF